MKDGSMPVLDSAARETEFKVDGVTYTLRHTLISIAGFEAGTGILPATEAIPPTVSNMLCLLYAGLRAHHSDVTMETVSSWFTPDTMDELCAVAWKSFYKTKPKVELEGERSGNPPSA